MSIINLLEVFSCDSSKKKGQAGLFQRRALSSGRAFVKQQKGIQSAQAAICSFILTPSSISKEESVPLPGSVPHGEPSALVLSIDTSSEVVSRMDCQSPFNLTVHTPKKNGLGREKKLVNFPPLVRTKSADI